jgi:hypothetical protein
MTQDSKPEFHGQPKPEHKEMVIEMIVGSGSQDALYVNTYRLTNTKVYGGGNTKRTWTTNLGHFLDLPEVKEHISTLLKSERQSERERCIKAVEGMEVKNMPPFKNTMIGGVSYAVCSKCDCDVHDCLCVLELGVWNQAREIAIKRLKDLPL